MRKGTSLAKSPRSRFATTSLIGFFLQLLWFPLAGPILQGAPRLASTQLTYAGIILLMLLCPVPYVPG